ncbi:MAG TPA: histidinol-phosphate transaminase, partial [Burkholderiales bacterium]|nr:histidinol-phosphate transaminase [Burkholderiales bacterium]
HVLVPLNAKFEIEVGDYLRPNGGIIFPNPNAPTGQLVPLADIERLLKANVSSVVVIDEAYVDFGGVSCVPLIQQYPQLLVTHTLSKSRALAGLRVGYVTGHADLIEALNRVKDSFNSYPLDRFAQAGATAAMEDEAYFQAMCRKVIDSKTRLVADLQTLGFEVLPSAANFIFARFPGRDGADIAAQLRERSIIVRHFHNPLRISPFMRITIGTDEQCAGLVDALRETIKFNKIK